MNNVFEYFDTIEASFRRMKLLTVATLACAAVIAVGALVFAFSYVGSSMDRIYIVDNMGQAYSAVAGDDVVAREMECRDHVVRFHELMFNLSPSTDAINRNIDRALAMADRTAYDYYMDNSERDYYRRLVNANMIQTVMVDSVKVYMETYPREVRTYATMYLIRESNMTSYALETTGRLVDVGRSADNPHGLMLERFNVIRNEKMETRRRN